MSAPSNGLSRFVERLYQVLSRSRKYGSRRPVCRRLAGPEPLEGRLAPAQLTVTSAADPTALTPGTLRYEVNQANSDAAAGVSDTIVFNATKMGSSTITLKQGQLELKAGSGTTTIDGGSGLITLSANNASRVFLVDSGAQAVLTKLLMRGGKVSGDNGGGISNDGDLTLNDDTLTGNDAADSVNLFSDVGGSGGGIANYGTLIVSNSTLSDNTAESDNGAPFNNGGSKGGGIANYGSLTVTDSTFSANSATSTLHGFGGDGGGIFTTQTLSVNNSTFFGNSAAGTTSGFEYEGGGICISAGTATVNDSTISGNAAGYGGGGISIAGGSLALEDTIVAANNATSTGPDISGSIKSDNGYNLLGTAVDNTSTDPTPGPHDVFSDTPGLAALAGNGGPTQTMALLSGSPAIGAGTAIAGITTDQRGDSRPNPPDIGAYQSQAEVLASIHVSAPGTAKAGSGFSVTITATDKGGSGYTGTVTLSSSDGQGVSPSSVTLSNGRATATITLDKSGSVKLSASASAITGTSGRIAVSAGAVATVNISAPSTATAGTAFGVTVTATDAYGNGVNAAATLTASDGQVVSPNSVTLVNGTATADITLDKAGVVTLSATAGSVTGNSDPITLSPAATNHLIFSVPPADTTAGSAIGPDVQVELLDPYGNVLTNDNTDTVTLKVFKGPAGFTGGSTTSVTLEGGVATFSKLVLNRAGNYIIQASDKGGPPAIQSSRFKISPAAATSFAVLPSTASVTAGTGFVVTFLAKDRYGNNVPTYSGPATLSCSDGQSVAPAAVGLGVGAASAAVVLSVADANPVTLTAAAPGIQGASIPLIVSAGVFGPPSAAIVSTTLYVSNPSGAMVEKMTFTVIVPNTAAGLDAAEDDITGEEGILSKQLSALGDSGYQITTQQPGTPGGILTINPFGTTGVVSLGDTIETFVPVSGTSDPAVSFVLSVTKSTPTGTQATTTVSAGGQESVTVTALDDNNDVATGYTGTVSLSSSDPQFGAPISYTFTPADDGSHTFSVNLYTAGIQSFTVVDSNSSSIDGETLVDVTPAAASSLIISAPGTDTAGSLDGVTVAALDLYGNVATNFNGTVSLLGAGNAPVAGLPPNYTFTSQDHGSHRFDVIFHNAGSDTIIASDAALASGATQDKVQVAPVPARLLITSPPPSAIAGGSSFGMVVEAVDGHGNVDGNFNGLVMLTLPAHPAGGNLGGVKTVQAVDGVAIFSGLTLNKAGSGYNIEASSGTVPAAATGPLSVTVGNAAKVVVISQPPGKVGAGNAFSVKVAVKDAGGNLVTSYSGTVTLSLAGGPSGATLGGTLTVNVINGVATFTDLNLTEAGSGYRLSASSGSLTAATTDAFKVKAGPAKQLTVSTQPPASVTAGSGFHLMVTAVDAFGNVATSFNGNVNLALVDNPGSATLHGTLTVQAENGVATFKGLSLNNVGNGYTIQTKSGKLTPATTSSIDVVSS